MPTYTLSAPNGKTYSIDGPAGASQEAVQAEVTRQHPDAVQAVTPHAQSAPDPSAGGGTLSVGPFDTGIKTPEWLDRGLAGTGKAFVDVARGAGQLTGLESRQDVANSRALDAPLMATTAGKVGNAVGNLAAMAPAAFIPGANTVVGASALGAASGLLQPSTSTAETARNVGLGGVVGGAGQAVAKGVGALATKALGARQTATDVATAVNAERDAALKQGQDLGLKVEPTAVNPSFTNTALQSVSGKAATRQAVRAANQPVVNDAVRSDLSIPANVPVSRDSIRAVINREGAVYQKVKDTLGNFQSDADYTKGVQGLPKVGQDLENQYPGIGAQASEQVKKLAESLDVPAHTGESVIGLYKLLNERAKANFQGAFGPGGANSQVLELARAQDQAADHVGELIQRQLVAAGKPELAQQWQTARTTIAKGYQALGALKGNDVDARVLVAQLRKGKPLSGDMGTVARFGDHFKDSVGIPDSGTGVSKLGAVVAGGGIAEGFHAAGIPGALAGAAVAAAPYATRAGIISRAGQNMLAQPSYAPNALSQLALKAGQKLSNGTLPLALTANHLVNSAQ